MELYALYRVFTPCSPTFLCAIIKGVFAKDFDNQINIHKLSTITEHLVLEQAIKLLMECLLIAYPAYKN